MKRIEPEWDAADLERAERCPACDGSKLVPALDGLADMEEGVPGLWSMVECCECRSLILDPRPGPEAISKAYRSYYTHQPPDAENAVLEGGGPTKSIAKAYIARRYGLGKGGSLLLYLLALLMWPLRQQLDYYLRHLPGRHGRLLDIGCGNGGFLQRARWVGWSVVGVEPDVNAAKVASEATGAEIHASISAITAERFDVITMSHVIEHLHQPVDMLQQCHQLLRPGGRIWIATPNIAGLGRRLYGEAWQALEVPRHLVMPTVKALSAMLTAAGFDEVRFMRRGRGAIKRLRASDSRAGVLGRRKWPVVPMAAIVDIVSSIWPFASEELVVVATRSER